MLPKKKSISELHESRINVCCTLRVIFCWFMLKIYNFKQKCFLPALPADLLLSFYVSSAKLICAAYHMQIQPTTGRQTFTVYQVDNIDINFHSNWFMFQLQGECVVGWLQEIIAYINRSLHLCQQLRDKVAYGFFRHYIVRFVTGNFRCRCFTAVLLAWSTKRRPKRHRTDYVFWFLVST